MPKYKMEKKIVASNTDLIPWRMYRVTGEGETIAEFIANCAVEELDQEDGVIKTTDFDGTTGLVQDEILRRLGCDSKAYFGLSCLFCHGTGRMFIDRPNQISSYEECPHCDKGVLK